jgi:hypothetical protein
MTVDKMTLNKMTGDKMSHGKTTIDDKMAEIKIMIGDKMTSAKNEEHNDVSQKDETNVTLFTFSELPSISSN